MTYLRKNLIVLSVVFMMLLTIFCVVMEAIKPSQQVTSIFFIAGIYLSCVSAKNSFICSWIICIYVQRKNFIKQVHAFEFYALKHFRLDI